MPFPSLLLRLFPGDREARAGQGRAQHGSAKRDAPLWRAGRER